MTLLEPSTTHHSAPPPETAGRPVRRSLLTPAEIAQLDRHDALDIAHVTKRFVKSGGGFSLPWRRHRKPRKAKVIRAVDDVTLRVKRREIYGVLGSNGSGKSTLIRVISTLLLPDEGSVRVFGHDVTTEERQVQRLINRVSVEAAFFRKLSPMENLLYSSRLYGMAGNEARTLINDILPRLGIKSDRITQPLENMSRGMQQKVAIARAFLTAPILLLLDEPTTGLDPRSKQDVQRFVLELRDAHDATILLTTHDMDEADALCDRLAIIDGGRIVAEGTPDELKAQVTASLALDHPATLTEVFMAHTGRDWEEDEPDDEQDETEDEETNE